MKRNCIDEVRAAMKSKCADSRGADGKSNGADSRGKDRHGQGCDVQLQEEKRQSKSKALRASEAKLKNQHERNQMEELPISRIRLNPDTYDPTTRAVLPLINGLTDRFYLSRSRAGDGIISDDKRRQIGTIIARDGLWYDLLTERAWNSPIAAAHVYLLALAPKQSPGRLEREIPPEEQRWRDLRTSLKELLAMPSMEEHLRATLRKTIRQIDAALRAKGEEE